MHLRGKHRRAVWWAAALAVAGALASVQGQIVIVDGLAVDLLEEDAEGPGPFQSGMSGLKTPVRIPPSSLAYTPPARSFSGAQSSEAMAHIKRAYAYVQNGESVKAFYEIRDALALEPGHPGVLNDAAALALSVKEYREAKGYLERYLEAQPRSAAHRAVYARVLLLLFDFRDAEEQLAILEKESPDNIQAHFYALILSALRDQPFPADARVVRRMTMDQLNALVQELVENFPAWESMVGAEELAALCAYLGLPNSVEALQDIGDQLQQYQSALRDKNKADERRLIEALYQRGLRAFGILRGYATAQLDQGRADVARTIWQELLQRDPEWADTWLNHAHFLLRAGAYEEAMASAQKARALAPQSPVAEFMVATTASMAGRPAEAGPLYNGLILKYKDNMQQWMDSDPLFWDAIKKMPNYAALVRMMGIPPENQ